MRASFAGFTMALICSTSAQAALVISTDATSNVTCSGGVCNAAAADAVLNVGDVTSMLASAPLTIQSGSLAQDILIEAPFSWTSSNALTLDSYRAITVDKPLADAGPAALTITTDDGGTGGELLFRYKGRISFMSTKNALTINGQSFTLVNSISSLASAVERQSLYLALADNYDAEPDGTYQTSPIPIFKRGFFEGLGNSISNLSINSSEGDVGLFGELKKATVADIGLVDASVTSSGQTDVGILAGYLLGATVRNTHSSGTIVSSGGYSFVGGLVGQSLTKKHLTSIISYSYSTAAVLSTGEYASVGGLVGWNPSLLEQSFASGTVKGGTDAPVGGLVGYGLEGDIENSYALGTATTGDFDGQSEPPASAGGLIGDCYGTIRSSFSTGAPTGGSGSYLGGFAGVSCSEFENDYWDTTTSGTKTGTSIGNVADVTGLTTKQLRSGLPTGFDPKVWAENPKINKGYPYLINNPPPK